jgi:hypothetical protein
MNRDLEPAFLTRAKRFTRTRLGHVTAFMVFATVCTQTVIHLTWSAHRYSDALTSKNDVK